MKVHSIVAAITNSSSEMYTFVQDNAITKIKKAIEEILSLAGFPENFDEIFDVEVHMEFKEYEEGYIEKTVEVVAKTDAEIKRANQRIRDVIRSESQPCLLVNVTVKRKADRKEMELSSLFESIFYSQEVSTG